MADLHRGQQILDSARIQTLISQLVDEASALEAGIIGVRPPNPALVEIAKRKMDEVGRSRGRPLFYPFLGTGAGRGPYVEVEDGSVKLDLINGIGIHIFGHSHPRLRAAAIRGALSDVVMQGNLEPNHEYHRLGQRLSELAAKRSRLKYCWFATCGTMANENALKISRQKNSPARMIMALTNAFAGRSTMMAEVTDNVTYKVGLPEYNEVLRVPFYDSERPTQSSEAALLAVKEHVARHPGNISVFVFEPMLGEGGYRWAPKSFFAPILDFCKEQKIAIWADEVQTFMRTGELFAYETLDLGPWVDICTVAKTLQTGATLYTEEYNPQPGLIAGTFSGSSTSFAAGLEALDILVHDGYLGPQGKIAAIHKDFVGMLNRLNETTCRGQLRDAGGLGLMIAVTPLDGGKETVNKLLQILYRNGLIAFSCGKDPYRLRFLVPAVMTEKDIKMAGEILEKSIKELT